MAKVARAARVASRQRTEALTASKTIQTATSIFTFRNILFIVLLIFLLSFLGLNIFTYLSDGTNFLTNLSVARFIISPLFADFKVSDFLLAISGVLVPGFFDKVPETASADLLVDAFLI